MSVTIWPLHIHDNHCLSLGVFHGWFGMRLCLPRCLHVEWYTLLLCLCARARARTGITTVKFMFTILVDGNYWYKLQKWKKKKKKHNVFCHRRALLYEKKRFYWNILSMFNWNTACLFRSVLLNLNNCSIFEFYKPLELNILNTLDSLFPFQIQDRVMLKQ